MTPNACIPRAQYNALPDRDALEGTPVPGRWYRVASRQGVAYLPQLVNGQTVWQEFRVLHE